MAKRQRDYDATYPNCELIKFNPLVTESLTEKECSHVYVIDSSISTSDEICCKCGHRRKFNLTKKEG